MTLQIAWLGPWNTRSAIATFGTVVIRELVARGHVVDIFRSETGSAASLSGFFAPGAVYQLAESTPSALHRSYDVVLANIGDNFEFHGAILPFLQEVPAILILHDLFLANLAAGWATSLADGEATLRKIVKETYGKDALPDGMPYWIDLASMVEQRPMVEYLASFGYGAVVHAHHYEARVRSACPGPVIALPVVALTPSDVAPPRPIRDTLTILTVGHVNRNKQPSQVIAAVASSPTLRRSCQYRMVGPIEDSVKRELLDLAAHLGVMPPEFTGWASDDDLRRYVSEADVIACLRNPVLEGASGSAILSLMSGRPTLVSNHGCYAEIPDGFVLKCAPGAEAEDVATHLEWILKYPLMAAEMGRRAARYAQETHSPVQYVDGLLRLVDQATCHLPGVLAGRAIGRELGALGVELKDPAVLRAAQGLADLLGSPRLTEARAPATEPSRPDEDI